jgi:hypothetical protein
LGQGELASPPHAANPKPSTARTDANLAPFEGDLSQLGLENVMVASLSIGDARLIAGALIWLDTAQLMTCSNIHIIA